ncbi:RHS repeat-associated core domain-containing protein [Prevotella nigrescens]
MPIFGNSKTSCYTYNTGGQRIMKCYGTMEGVYINRAPQGITFYETDNFTLYPASILSVNKNRFTKHYFLGDKRVASRIGTGLFNNVYGRNGSYVTAGQQDYAERMNQIQKQKEAYYKQQGIAPGVPTMKGAYGDPENTKRGYNSIIDTLGNHDVPQGWIQTPRPNTTPNTNPGPPVSWNDPSNPDDPQAGYGYIPNDTTKEETFFYHSDHLGSTSYITDDHANITQYDAYLPYGELLVDEHSSSEDLPYKFNGKQFDNETGLYYYGARYLNPVASIWYGVDPLAEKYIDVSAYLYCYGNPIKMIDSNGKETHVALNKDGTYSVIGGKLNEDRNIYIYSKDKYGRYTIRGKSIGITTSVTSFYNSDKQKWAIGSTIDVRDNSGDKFLTSLITKKPSLFNDYMTNARTGHLYDFKYSNGTINTVDDGKDIYRGMPIGITGNGQTIFTSARDVGNIAAGYIAGINGMSWKASRTAFDAYQSKSSGKPTIEGLSTRNAENYGWRMGSNIKNYTPNQKATNLVQSINDGLKALGKYLYNRIKNIF